MIKKEQMDIIKSLVTKKAFDLNAMLEEFLWMASVISKDQQVYLMYQIAEITGEDTKKIDQAAKECHYNENERSRFTRYEV